MNAPKKPGTDLSALKARLAKKDAPAAAPDAAPAAPAAPKPPSFKKSQPAADFPPPGEVAVDIPPPGEVSAPAPMDIPAPGEVLQPRQPEPVAAAAPQEPARRKSLEDGTPFGTSAGSFDPNAGLIGDAGEVAPKGNKGLTILASAAALAFGVALGWIGHQITSKGDLVAQAKAKGGVMFNEAVKVSDMRKGISLKIDELQKLVSTDPVKGTEELANLLKANFEKTPKVDDLFGWQLAGIGPEGIRRTFDLYEEANGLRLDLGYLANFVGGNAKALTDAGGPRVFGVKFKKDGSVVLVERGEPVCGEAACAEGKELEATGFKVRETVNAEWAVAARGTEEGQVLPLSADSQIFAYVVGLNPENNAKLVAASLFAKVKQRLEDMSKAEGRALKALKSYSDDPNVDGGGPADPGAD